MFLLEKIDQLLRILPVHGRIPHKLAFLARAFEEFLLTSVPGKRLILSSSPSTRALDWAELSAAQKPKRELPDRRERNIFSWKAFLPEEKEINSRREMYFRLDERVRIELGHRRCATAEMLHRKAIQVCPIQAGSLISRQRARMASKVSSGSGPAATAATFSRNLPGLVVPTMAV